MKKTLGLAAAAVLSLTLTACGDDGGSGGGEFDEAAYCNAYKDARNELENFEQVLADPGGLESVKERISDLEGQAPADLQDDWRTMGTAFDELESIFQQSGLSLEDLATLDPTNLPEGVDEAELQELMTKVQAFAENQKYQKAADAIAKDGETRCDVPAEGGES